MAAAALGRVLRISGRERLACHWYAQRKQMTKHNRCDNKCKLGTHAVENGRTGQGNTASFGKAKVVLRAAPCSLAKLTKLE